MELTYNNLKLIIDEKLMEPTSLTLNGVEFLYQKTASWKKDFPTLFPICGMLVNDKYTNNGQEYSLKRHGFFREINDWKLIISKPNYAKFNFQSNGKFLQQYPWEFSLDYEFELLSDELKITTSVTNLSDDSMYYSLGYHPAFQTQPNGLISFDQAQNLYRDSVELKYLVEQPVDKVVVDQTKVNELDFTNSQFFWTSNNQAKKVNYQDQDKEFSINLTSYLNKTFILWSENNDANYVCFEPMDGHADFANHNSSEISQKAQITKLDFNQTNTHHFDIKLKTKN